MREVLVRVPGDPAYGEAQCGAGEPRMHTGGEVGALPPCNTTSRIKSDPTADWVFLLPGGGVEIDA